MGWTRERASRDEVVARQKGPRKTVSGHVVTATQHHRDGDEDWFVFEVRDEDGVLQQKIIAVTLWDGEYYKQLQEEQFPYASGCPLEWLDEVPVTCQEWRDAVKGKVAA